MAGMKCVCAFGAEAVGVSVEGHTLQGKEFQSRVLRCKIASSASVAGLPSLSLCDVCCVLPLLALRRCKLRS